jgi:polyisoprenoid-binding protein YceI
MRIPLIGLALVAAVAMNANAQARVNLAPASKLWIEGTSNVHDWKAEAAVINAEIEIDAAGLSAAPAKLVRKVTITVPVKDLKSGKGGMDNNIQKALKADKNPDIVYTLTTIEAVSDTKDGFTLRAQGTLKLAGGESAVTAEIVGTRQPDGSIKATGTVPVKMTAFGVKPPTAMLGAIKCGDDVQVKFDLLVGQKVVAAIGR